MSPVLHMNDSAGSGYDVSYRVLTTTDGRQSQPYAKFTCMVRNENASQKS